MKETDLGFSTRCQHCMAKGRDSYEDPITGEMVDRCERCPHTQAGRERVLEDALRGGIIRRF